MNSTKMQPVKAALDRRSQMLRVAVLDPFVRSGPLKAGFGRDQEIGRIGMQRLGDQKIANYGAVGVGGVEEIDTQIERASTDSVCLDKLERFYHDDKLIEH